MDVSRSPSFACDTIVTARLKPPLAFPVEGLAEDGAPITTPPGTPVMGVATDAATRGQIHMSHDVRLKWACPCQVLQKAHCTPTHTRNFEGGIGNLRRLKEHISRKHVRSNLCPRCWVLLPPKNRRKSQRPVKSHTTCVARPMPQDMFLMNPEQERMVKKHSFPSRSSMSQAETEDAWWSLLGIFAPELKRFGKNQLANHVSPYYSSRNTVSVSSLIKTLEDESASAAGRTTLCLDNTLHFDDTLYFEDLLSAEDSFLYSTPWSQQTSNEATAALGGHDAQQHLPCATSVPAYPEIDITSTNQPAHQFEPLPCPNCKGTGKICSYPELFETRLQWLEKQLGKAGRSFL